MDELRYVVKCFLFSALLIALSQIKTEDGTIEHRLHAALVSSETAAFVNKAAAGGAKGLLDLKEYLKEQVEKRKKNSEEQSSEDVSDVESAQNKKTDLQRSAIEKIQKVEAQITNQLQNAPFVEEDQIIEIE